MSEEIEQNSKITSNDYTAKNIGELDFPLNIQKRPGMYLGSKGESGKAHTTEEIIANCIDEFSADKNSGKGYGKKINFEIRKRNLKGIEYQSIFVKDRGRGIPIDMHKSGEPALTYILTNLHVGGKIKEGAVGGSSYVASGGLNGIGASAVMAVSRFFRVIVARDERVVRQTFEFGYQVENMFDLTPKEYDSSTDKTEFLVVNNFNGKADLEQLQIDNPNKYIIENGTEVEYVTWDKVDDEDIEGLFEPFINWNTESIKMRLHELTYLKKNLEIIYDNETKENSYESYCEENGIQQFLIDRTFNEDNKEQIILDPIFFEGFIDNGVKKYIDIEGTEELNPRYKFLNVELSIGFGVFSDITRTKKHFVNNLPMTGGGKQSHGLYHGITKVLNEFAEKYKLIKNIEEKKNRISNDDLDNVMNFILSIGIENPDFEGQTKNKLGNTEAQTLMREFLSGNKSFEGVFKEWADINVDIVKNLIKQIETVRNEKKKSENNFEKLLMDRLSQDAILSNSNKLSDCRIKDNLRTELFICEGDSASGPIKNSRNSDFQALLPMKGKMLKAWEDKNSMDRLAKNDEVGSIITSLQCGWHNSIDVEKCRYSKIIILSDADDDGYHITTLLETLFLKYFTKLVEDGRVYIALSPLYELVKNGKKTYIYNNDELNELLLSSAKELNEELSDSELKILIKEELVSTKKKKFGYQIKRNKGLGELEPEDMWQSTLDPNTRRLVQLEYNGTPEEIEKINVYMSGDANYIEKRRDILTNLNMKTIL